MLISKDPIKNSWVLFVLGFLLVSIIIFLAFNLFKENSYKVITPSSSPTVSAPVVKADIYPDPQLTPGDVFPNVTKKDVCTPGYTQKVRNVTLEQKKKVYQEYNLEYSRIKGSYVVDHFIPLELGGSNDIKNLWPEQSSGSTGSKSKDVVENYLHAQVCADKKPLQTAQEEIRTDWYKVYQQILDKDFYRTHNYE